MKDTREVWQVVENDVTYCVCLTKNNWYDVVHDGNAEKDSFIEKVLEKYLSYSEAYERVMFLRDALRVHSE